MPEHILKLIHQNVDKFSSPCIQDILSLRKKFITTEDHIIKIQLAFRLQSLLIAMKNVPEYLIRATGCIIMLRRNTVPLYDTDFPGNFFNEISLLSHFLSIFLSHLT